MSYLNKAREADPIIYYHTNSFCVKIIVDEESFYGWSECAPEDQAYFSEFMGIELARLRAVYEALKHHRKQLKQEWEYWLKFANQMYNISDEYRKIGETVFSEYNWYKIYTKEAAKAIKEKIKAHDQVITFLEKRKKMKEQDIKDENK